MPECDVVTAEGAHIILLMGVDMDTHKVRKGDYETKGRHARTSTLSESVREMVDYQEK